VSETLLAAPGDYGNCVLETLLAAAAAAAAAGD